MNVQTYLTVIIVSSFAQLHPLTAITPLVNGRLMVFKDYTLSNSPLLDMDMIRSGWSTIKCSLKCQQMPSCKSLSIKKDLSRCRLYDVSLAAIGSSPIRDDKWKTYVFVADWQPIVKYSTRTEQYNGLNMAEFYSSDNYNASFPDDICGVDPAQKCSRPYKHTLQKELLGNDDVKQVKLSVYKDGTEVAWATFNKNSGVNDVWFHPSRVIDSHPWDKTQLRTKTANFQQEIHGSGTLFWSISEGSKLNVAEEDRQSAHARWVAMETAVSCDMIVGSVAGPAIMYSKEADPVFLIHRGTGWVHKGGTQVYDTPGTEATGVCQNYLHTTIATLDDMNNVFENNPYSCCSAGWVVDSNAPDGLRSVLPMNVAHDSCWNSIGVLFWSEDIASSAGVFCKKNSAAVEEGDTLVISVKLM